MLWSDLPELYPERWAMVSAVESRFENGKQYVEEVAVIRPLRDGRDAKRVLMQCTGNTFVYHTINPEIVIEGLPNPLLRTTYAH